MINMKNFIFLLIAVFGMTAPIFSQENKLAWFDFIGWWDNEYLTATWGGTIKAHGQDSQKAVDYIVSLVDNATNADRSYYHHLTDPYILFGSRLLEIDGQDAKGMTEKQAYNILAEKRGHTFRLEDPTDGVYEASINESLPVWMQAYGFQPLTCNWKTESQELPDNYVIRIDKEAPWRTFKTYDFLILSDDVLADKELLEKIGRVYGQMGFTRDEMNPDILISVTKDANKSIEYTYVPETSQQVQTGSKSYALYGWKGTYLGNYTVNNYKTVKSGGYTQKTASTSAYLEVSVLQASRLGESVIPMIYQLKYNYNKNTDANVDNLYLNAINWVEHPLYDSYSMHHLTSSTCGKYFWNDEPLINFGIVTDAQNVVIGLDRNSDVVNSSGLQKGDKIVAIKSTFKKGMNGKTSKSTYYGTITVKRNNMQQELKFSRCRKTNNYKITFVSTYSVK